MKWRTVLVGAVLFAALVFYVNATRAHEWYPIECCSGYDCAPIPLAEAPREENGGFTLIDGRHVPYKDVKMSPDNQWHLCEQKWPAEVRLRKILCFYAPIGGA